MAVEQEHYPEIGVSVYCWCWTSCLFAVVLAMLRDCLERVAVWDE